ncbi:unnamed protein product [Schistosoma mattheei]|uniref:Cap-specific mRNA (nucleoside-2'-O-)-methyltransferase 1 n=1 Tax=Schistosoma mattheei TaxID=31246 RepID=A0A183NQD6_9TREM|nr:unnamed protein product [Schistosoma mattheei]
MNDKLLEDTTESVDHNSPTNNTSTTSEKQQPLLSAKGFGLTLTGHCDFRENDFLAGPKEAFMAHYGPGRDGDVTKWSNLASFASFIGRSTNNAGVHILMADGVSSVINFFVMTIVYFKSCSKSFLICLSLTESKIIVLLTKPLVNIPVYYYMWSYFFGEGFQSVVVDLRFEPHFDVVRNVIPIAFKQGWVI